MKFYTVSFLAVALATTAPFPAYAAEGSKASESELTESQEPIVVEGRRPEYGAKATSTATKTHTEIKDVPQAMSVVSEKQIEDQQLRSIAELLYFVPGATPGTGESNRDQFTLRGNTSTADFFIDGIRDDVQYFRDFYNVDRVEVLRGPNAMIFGRGGGGGIINRVTKRTSLTPARDFVLSGDSWGGYRLTADLDEPFASSAGVRLNAMYENGESFRRHVDLERYAANPTVGVLLGSQTRFDIGFEHLDDRRTTDRGLPSQAGRPLEGFDRTFFGDPELSFAKANVDILNAAIQHELAEGLTVRNRTLLGDYDKFYQNVYPNGPVSDGLVRLSAYNDTYERRNLFSQTDLIWDGHVGGIDQTLLFGFELGRQKGRNQRRNGVFSSTGTGPSSIFVPVEDPTVDVDVTFLANGLNNDIRASVGAIYVQDQVRPTDWLEVVAGLRFDRFSVDVDNRNNGQEFERTDNLWSPRLGLIFKPRPNLSLYASYSRSYLPQSGDQFNTLDLTSEALKPERFDNYEIGAKWEPVQGLLATAALYQLDRTNTRAPNPDGSGTVVLTGAQRSRGLELGLERSISHRWQVSAGYSWQKAQITETTSAAPAGREVPLVPRHSFSLWNRYDLNDRLGLGLGMIARTKSYASISNQVTLPGYARVDAAAYYRLTPKIELQLNVENLFGADYFPTAHNDNNIAPGAPFTAKASLRLAL
ncbi:MAG TPA: TonB-dependent siderophore receptor [Sphingomicrobium sp.]|nr:TonB-dependent siderophore receptor [Sphingomicrobium sp.]